MLITLLLAISIAVTVLLSIFGPWQLAPLYFVGGLLLLAALAFAFLVVACQIVDKDKPQQKDSKFYRILAHLYIQAALPLAGARLHVQGMEKLPKEGRFLLVCNHIHDIDPGILLHCFPKSHLVFIAKQETKDMFLIGALLHKLQCHMINRENDREALKTILNCIQMIKDDRASIMAFPEGYVSLDGKLRHFRSGVFKIAQKAQVPVVVCTIQGCKEVLPNLAKLKPSHIHMHLVDVIPTEEVCATSTVDLAERVYELMIADMGEEFRTDEKSMHPDLQRQRMEQAAQL